MTSARLNPERSFEDPGRPELRRVRPFPETLQLRARYFPPATTSNGETRRHSPLSRAPPPRLAAARCASASATTVTAASEGQQILRPKMGFEPENSLTRLLLCRKCSTSHSPWCEAVLLSLLLLLLFLLSKLLWMFEIQFCHFKLIRCFKFLIFKKQYFFPEKLFRKEFWRCVTKTWAWRATREQLERLKDASIRLGGKT